MSSFSISENIISCHSCGQSVDASGIEIGSLINCPSCNHEFRVTQRFGNYLLEQQIGAGGMGAVFSGLDINLNRLVAIKVLKNDLTADPKFTSTFLYEAEITASLNHPNIVQVYAFGEHNGLYYLVMEHISGGSLDDRIMNYGGVTELEGIEIGIAIASGLEFAQQRGLIHRDIKPGNILFGANNTPKVVDFGLSLSSNSADLFEGEIWGTPYYVAPEKLENQPEDFRSDMYSLGTTLFHAIAGRPPYEDPDPTQVALKHLKGTSVSIKAFAPQISNQTALAISRSMARYPDDRFQSYAEFISQLEDAKRRLLSKNEQDQEDTSAPIEIIESPEEGKHQTVIVTAMVILSVLLLVGCFFIFRGTGKKSDIDSEDTDISVNYATGGSATASTVNETAIKAFDGNRQTRWFSGTKGGSGWVQYHFGNGQSWAVTLYKITNGSDMPQRDPASWQLQGSTDGSHWVTLDTQIDQKFSQRSQTLSYSISNEKAFPYYRLNVMKTAGQTDGIQIAEIGLYSSSK